MTLVTTLISKLRHLGRAFSYRAANERMPRDLNLGSMLARWWMRALRVILRWAFRSHVRRYFARLPLPPSVRWRFSARRYQPFGYTLPNRYPWLFEFAHDVLDPEARILSFGCSTGEEVLSLRRYLPSAIIKGIDIDPHSIAVARRRTAGMRNVELTCTSTVADEERSSYDAVFCLAVLCHGQLTAEKRQRSDPLFRFEDFATAIADLTRCLKPGGMLFLLTTNFRFRDTSTAEDFELMLSARSEQLALDRVYDRNGNLLENERYCEVVFRKIREVPVSPESSDA